MSRRRDPSRGPHPPRDLPEDWQNPIYEPLGGRERPRWYVPRHVYEEIGGGPESGHGGPGGNDDEDDSDSDFEYPPPPKEDPRRRSPPEEEEEDSEEDFEYWPPKDREPPPEMPPRRPPKPPVPPPSSGRSKKESPPLQPGPSQVPPLLPPKTRKAGGAAKPRAAPGAHLIGSQAKLAFSFPAGDDPHAPWHGATGPFNKAVFSEAFARCAGDLARQAAAGLWDRDPPQNQRDLEKLLDRAMLKLTISEGRGLLNRGNDLPSVAPLQSAGASSSGAMPPAPPPRSDVPTASRSRRKSYRS